MERTPPIDAKAFNAFEAEGWDGASTPTTASSHPSLGVSSGPLLDAVGVVPGTRLLDVATGPGHLPARAAERGAVPVGVDVADAMVTRARELYPTLEFHRGMRKSCRSQMLSLTRSPPTSCSPISRGPSGPWRNWSECSLLAAGWPWRHGMCLPGRGCSDSSSRLSARSVPHHRQTSRQDPTSFASPTMPPSPICSLQQGCEMWKCPRSTSTTEAATFDEYWQALQEGTVRMSSLLHGQSKETRLRIRDALKQKLNEHHAPNRHDHTPCGGQGRSPPGRKLS